MKNQFSINPKQERAFVTRNALQNAFVESLARRGYLDTSIAAVAETANSSVGAFQNHFGTKKGALFHFWEEYCKESHKRLDAIKGQFLRASSFKTEEFLFYISSAVAELQEKNVGLNQAMNVHFVKDRNIHQKTMEIMEGTVGTIFEVVSAKTDAKVSPEAARFATQIIITLNLNYTLGGARLLPAKAEARHKGIASSAAAHLV
jgi:AcrR family transcriptional regulator